MKKYAPIIILVCCFILPESALSGMKVGMAVGSSSNMLLRPDGESGVISSVDIDADKVSGKNVFAYNGRFGMIERYDGVQFHTHELSVSRFIANHRDFAWNIEMLGRFARYGEVTVLEGHHHLRLSSNVKSYLTDSLLFRWKGTVGRKAYRHYSRENFLEASTVYRLDRFFAGGTTLRGQFDAGYRRYIEQVGEPEAYLFGYSVRAARSLRPGWGAMLEAYTRRLTMSTFDDNSQVFNRVFLDDRYKYTSTGAVLGSTWVIRRVNSVQLRFFYTTRIYNDTQAAYFPYLPPDGWEEYERSAYLSVRCRPGWFPDAVCPMLEIYYTDVNATEGSFSYDGSGVTFKIEIQ